MDTFTIVGIVVLVGVALVLVLYPLWQQTRHEVSFQANGSGQTLEEYEARYQAQLAAIKDLMFDYEMGKVSSEDYETFVTKAKLEAAEIRQHLDSLSVAPASNGINAALDAEIEALITRLRHNAPASSDDNTLEEEVDAEIELLKQTQPEAITGIICPNCNHVLQPDDAFCSRCGQPAPAPEPASDVCPQCGHTVQPDDAFCARCGTALAKDKRYQDARI